MVSKISLRNLQFLNKKAAFTIIMGIIGGTIMVIVMMMAFTLFSAPYLDYMTDNENLRSFGKFTTGLSKGCNSGLDTEIHFGLSTTAAESYIISAVGENTATYLSDSALALTSTNSKLVVKKCKDTYCYCLLKGTLKEGYILAPDQNVLTKEAPLNAVENASYMKSGSKSYQYSGAASHTPAQSFVTLQNGEIQAVWIKGTALYPDSFAGELTVGIYKTDSNGRPDTNKFLGSGKITADDIKTVHDGWFRVSISGIELYTTQSYAIVLSSADDMSNNYFLWHYSTTKGGSNEAMLSAGDAFVVNEIGDWDKCTDISLDVSAFDYIVEIVPPSTIKNLINWDSELKNALASEEEDPFSKLEVLQCRNIISDLKCGSTDNSKPMMLPEIEKDGTYNSIVWLQPKFTTDTSVEPVKDGRGKVIGYRDVFEKENFNLKFDSYTFSRPVSKEGTFENHVLSFTEPDLSAFMNIADTETANIGEYPYLIKNNN